MLLPGGWDLEGMAFLFEEPINDLPKEHQILWAEYDFSGNAYAYVLFVDDNGDLYEVVGSHSPCYQWSPRLTSWKALLIRQGLEPVLENIVMARADIHTIFSRWT